MGIICQVEAVIDQAFPIMCVTMADMAPKRAGASSQAVAGNLLLLRNTAGISLRQLSTELADRGVSITAQSLSAIEKGETAVTVDLLTALAAVLGVSPITLLLPYTEDGFEPQVSLTGTEQTYPISLHEWLAGVAPLGLPINTTDIDPRLVTGFRDRAQPKWLREKD